MNSIQPAARARAVTGFQDVKAGAGSIAHCAWNRSLLWLLVKFLPLVILTSLSVGPARANGVTGTIANGQTVNGAVSGKGIDTYTFHAVAGGAFVVALAETGQHDPSFRPEINVLAPGASGGPGSAHPFYASFVQPNAAEGTWTLKISRSGGGTSGGSYALTLVQTPGAVATNHAMAPGQPYVGSNTRGQLEAWTFNGAAGHAKTLTVNVTGGAGFVPEALVFSPTGDLAGGFGCGLGTCTPHDVPIKANGTYTIIVRKTDGEDVTGGYSLSVNDKTN
jgi:hypothetical protein